MAKGKSPAFARIRAEVIRLVALIPEGKEIPDNSLVTGTATVHAAFSASQPEALSTPI